MSEFRRSGRLSRGSSLNGSMDSPVMITSINLDENKMQDFDVLKDDSSCLNIKSDKAKKTRKSAQEPDYVNKIIKSLEDIARKFRQENENLKFQM